MTGSKKQGINPADDAALKDASNKLNVVHNYNLAIDRTYAQVNAINDQITAAIASAKKSGYTEKEIAQRMKTDLLDLGWSVKP